VKTKNKEFDSKCGARSEHLKGQQVFTVASSAGQCIPKHLSLARHIPCPQTAQELHTVGSHTMLTASVQVGSGC